MVQLAIRCHPCAPVPADELEGWLEQQVDELRALAPHATLRLSRLTQGGPSTDSLRDMRLLGLQPTLLARRDGWTNGTAA